MTAVRPRRLSRPSTANLVICPGDRHAFGICTESTKETHDELIILRWGKDVHGATHNVNGTSESDGLQPRRQVADGETARNQKVS